jgi:hypothetical protein
LKSRTKTCCAFDEQSRCHMQMRRDAIDKEKPRRGVRRKNPEPRAAPPEPSRSQKASELSPTLQTLFPSTPAKQWLALPLLWCASCCSPRCAPSRFAPRCVFAMNHGAFSFPRFRFHVGAGAPLFRVSSAAPPPSSVATAGAASQRRLVSAVLPLS